MGPMIFDFPQLPVCLRIVYLNILMFLDQSPFRFINSLNGVTANLNILKELVSSTIMNFPPRITFWT